MSLQSQITALAQAIGLDIKSILSSISPKLIDYRIKSGADNLNTVLSTMSFDSIVINDNLFTYSMGEYTATSLVSGKRIRVDWSIAGFLATNRVQIDSELQLNTGSGFNVVKQMSNYTARNNVQERGGINGFHVLTLNQGDVIRLQAKREGSNCFNITNATSMLFQTI